MQIITLVENHSHPKFPHLQAEHGVSFYIEVGNHVYLSDVGASNKFADNAAHLGVDLSRVEALAISHHHYDHGGGLERFFQENDTASVYLRQTAVEDFVVSSPPEPLRYIGLDKAVLNKYSRRIEMITENREVLPGFHLLTEIPQKYPKPRGDQRLQVLDELGLKPDPFTHEMVTVFVEEHGLVVLTGCAHNGVLNMIAAARAAFPGQPILAAIGGFHLHHETPETVYEIGESLLAEEIPAVITGHCTGEQATDILAEVLGPRLQRLYTGLEMSF